MSAKILLIEDDEAIVETLRVMLESRGFAVEVLEDCDEGATQIVAMAPDLLILDLHLPGRDGMEIYKNIKDSGRLADMPVIVLSSLSKRHILAAAESGGTVLAEDTVFSKPIDPEGFISKIEKMLAGE